MTRNVTTGDSSEVECPVCGKDICTIDLSIDGCLTEGNYFTCEHCDAEVEIETVEYAITIYVRALDRWLDFCEAWGQIGRFVQLRAQREAEAAQVQP